MSRCFPFPPPGYEKKARPDDDASILKKEEHKEKKHKKDKKEKKEKEKRDKEKHGEKNGEKNDRKRKHKEKDKKKDNEEKKDSELKETAGSSSHRNDEKKHAAVGIQVDQTHQGGILRELEKGFGEWNGPNEIQGLDKNSFKELSVKSSGKELGSNHGIFVEGNQKFKHIREENKLSNNNVQSLKVVGKHLENGSLGNSLSNEQRILEETVCQDEKVSEKRKERKDKSKHKSSNGKGDKHKHGDRERKSKSKDKKEKKEKKMEVKMNDVFPNPVQTKVIENGNSSVNIQNDRESYPFKWSSSNNGYLAKRKEPEMNGFVHGSGSAINKLPRLSSSSKVKQNGTRDDATDTEVRSVMESEAAERKLDGRASCSFSVPENGTKLETRQTTNNRAPERRDSINDNHKAFESLSTPQASLLIGRKLEPSQSATDIARKEQGTVTDFKVNKKVLSEQPIAENGRKLESSKPCTFPSAERKGAVSKPKFNDQEIRINGLGLRKPDAISKRPPGATDPLKETVEGNLKPPHPDAKYLTELLTVPKVEWSDIDDQSWLHAREDQRENKRRRVFSKLEEPKVWAEALQLESADITALPYVIPY